MGHIHHRRIVLLRLLWFSIKMGVACEFGKLLCLKLAVGSHYNGGPCIALPHAALSVLVDAVRLESILLFCFMLMLYIASKWLKRDASL